MATSRRTLADLSGELVTYPQVLLNVRVGRRADVAGVPPLAATIAERRVAARGHGRLLVRYSGTEPLLRIMLEGKDQAEIHATGRGDCRRGPGAPGLIRGAAGPASDVAGHAREAHDHATRRQHRPHRDHPRGPARAEPAAGRRRHPGRARRRRGHHRPPARRPASHQRAGRRVAARDRAHQAQHRDGRHPRDGDHRRARPPRSGDAGPRAPAGADHRGRPRRRHRTSTWSATPPSTCARPASG